MSGKPWPPRSDEAYLKDAEEILSADLLALFRKVRLMVFDVDGIFTSGNIIYGPQGEALKEFDSRDGLGLVMARAAEIKLAILTGRDSEIAARRARDLKFNAIKLGRFDKQTALQEILEELSVPADQALYMGDDLIDIPAMDLVAVPVTVPAAPRDVKERAVFATTSHGGDGALREVVELVLKSRGLFGQALSRISDRSWL
jgi:3-deoxy-D-manno-octulosonate 8-phosphate phosphatase (KDO 8-P phosphatase)